MRGGTQRIAAQLLDNDIDDVASPREPCLRVADASLGLKAACAQPLVREIEALTAVIVLQVLDAGGAPVLENGDVLRHAIRNVREQLRQVDRRVGIVVDTDEQNLAVEIVHAADRDSPGCGRKATADR